MIPIDAAETGAACSSTGRRWLGHAGVALLFALLMIPRHFLMPYYHLNPEDSTTIAHVNFPGFPWRWTAVALWNWIGLPLFGEWWQGMMLIGMLVTLGMALSAYFLWLELGHQLRGPPAKVPAGAQATGIVAAYLLTMAGYDAIPDATGAIYRLAGLFTLLTMALSLRFHRSGSVYGRVYWWLATMAAYVLACFSHGFAWPLPLMLLLLELTVRRRAARKSPVWAVVLRYAPMLCVPVVIIAVLNPELPATILSDGGITPPAPGAATPDLLLGRLIYAVGKFSALGPGLLAVTMEAHPLEWVLDGALVLVGLAGVGRMVRGRGMDLFSVVTFFILVWFVLALGPLYIAGADWPAGLHRFSYLQAGLLVAAAYLIVRLVALAGLLAPASWRPRWTGIGVGILMALYLPWSPVGAGLAQAWETGHLGLDPPCPARDVCQKGEQVTGWRLMNKLTDGDLRCMDLSLMDNPRLNLTGADLRRVNLTGAHLMEADMRGARLGNACAYFSDLRGIKAHKADFKDARIIAGFLDEADLSGADLRRTSLRCTSVHRATLRGADLRGADLVRTSFQGSDLRGANLAGANLTGGELAGADLRGANLRNTSLLSANATSARLEGADLTGALICQDKGAELNSGLGFKGTPKLVPCGREPPEHRLRPPWY